MYLTKVSNLCKTSIPLVRSRTLIDLEDFLYNTQVSKPDSQVEITSVGQFWKSDLPNSQLGSHCENRWVPN